MKKYEYENFEVMINDDETKELMFDKYKIVQYKAKSKSIGKYGAYFYLVDTTKDFKTNRISAVYTQGHELKEFYFDTVRSHYKGFIENEKLLIDEIKRDDYLKIVNEIKDKIKGVA